MALEENAPMAHGIAYVCGLPRKLPMTSITVTEARLRLCKLLETVSDSHEPIQITGKRHSAVLISEADWRVVQETLYLLSIPGMPASIRRGLKTPVEQCHAEPGW